MNVFLEEEEKIGCHMTDLTIPSHELNDIPNGKPIKVNDVHECQRYCQRDKECKYYTFHSDGSGWCNIFKDHLGWYFQRERMSGVKYCESKSNFAKEYLLNAS